jgi:hypothetical protein
VRRLAEAARTELDPLVPFPIRPIRARSARNRSLRGAEIKEIRTTVFEAERLGTLRHKASSN